MKPAAGLQFSEKGFVESQRLSDNGLEMGGGRREWRGGHFLSLAPCGFYFFQKKALSLVFPLIF